MVSLKEQIAYGRSIAESSIFGHGARPTGQTLSVSAHITPPMFLDGRDELGRIASLQAERRAGKTPLPGMRMFDDFINDYVVAPSMNAGLITESLLWAVEGAATLFESSLRLQYFLNGEEAAMRGLPQVFALPSLSASAGVMMGLFQECAHQNVGVLVHMYNGYLHKMYAENSLCSLVMPVSVEMHRFFDKTRWAKMSECFRWTDGAGVEHGWRKVLFGERSFRAEQIDAAREQVGQARLVQLSGAEASGVSQAGLVHVAGDRWLVPYGFDVDEVAGRLKAISSGHPQLCGAIEKVSCVCRAGGVGGRKGYGC